MMIQSVHKGRTIKDVSVLDTDNYTDAEVIDFAMSAAGESRSSLFGWNIKRYDASAVVTLHID